MDFIKAILKFFADIVRAILNRRREQQEAEARAEEEARAEAERVSEEIKEEVEDVPRPEIPPDEDPFVHWNQSGSG